MIPLFTFCNELVYPEWEANQQLSPVAVTVSTADLSLQLLALPQLESFVILLLTVSPL
jgi:hypothetical protein